MNFETMSKQRKMILIAAAIGIISMFLPWVSVFGFSVNGMNGWGVLVFLCFAAAGAVSFMGDQTRNLNQTNWMITLIAGGIASLIMLINFLRTLSNIGHLSFGFYGALAAAIGIVAFTFKHRSASDSLQGGYDSLKNSFNSKMNTTQNGHTTTTTTTNVSHTSNNDPTRPIV
jgi:peptidoglycan/LPS O-acetylase OafA/YrhL